MLLAIWLVYLLRSTLFLFMLAVLFAYLLAPLVNLVDRFLPGKRTRTVALAISYVLVVGAVVVGAILIGSRVVDQATDLAQTLPKTAKTWASFFQSKVPASMQEELVKRGNAIASSIPQYAIQFLAFMENLIYVVIVPVLAFLCLKDGALVRKHMLGLAGAGPGRKLFSDVLADIHLVLTHYMRALVLLSLATMTTYSIVLTAMGAHFGILLGVMAGLLEFIPMIGPLAGGVIVLVVGGATTGHWLAIVIFLVAFRMFQDYVLSPHLMGHGVELHPLLVLFGVFGGAELAGVPGTFLSVPLLAIARVIYLRVYRSREENLEEK